MNLKSQRPLLKPARISSTIRGVLLWVSFGELKGNTDLMTSIAGEIFILFERKAFRKGLSKVDKGKSLRKSW